MFVNLNNFNTISSNYINILKTEVDENYELYAIKKISKNEIKNYNKNDILIRIKTDFINFIEIKKEFHEINNFIKNWYKIFYKNFNNQISILKTKNNNIIINKKNTIRNSINELKFDKKNTLIYTNNNDLNKKFNFNFFKNRKNINNIWLKKTNKKINSKI